MKIATLLFSIHLLVSLSPFPLFSQEPTSIYHQLFLPGSGIEEKIKSKLEGLALNPNLKFNGTKVHNIEYITNLYLQNGFNPFWTESVYADDAVQAILNSYHDGLIPLDYHLEAILSLKNNLTLNAVANETKIEGAAELDILITDGIIFYADHLLFGKIDPESLIPTWNFGYAPIPELDATAFRDIIENHGVAERLDELRPQLFLYDTLLHTLAHYRDMEGRGGWPVILTGGKIEPGDNDSRLPQIRQRLAVAGYLTASDSTGGTFYDAGLEKDIRRFQQVYGLDPDGVIGAGTLRELNVSVQERIATIRVNMERIRWTARNLPENFLIVNIAAFYLTLVREGKIIYREKVVVGKPLNKTPVFRDKMRYIEFNPTWTQPTSIVRNETIPKLKKDPGYLEKNHMVLLDSKGNIVPTSMLDMENLSPSRFPYLVRQLPGPWNALGVVKFMFPNKYDIYLHDTPSKSLFNKASRAYSHGCVRVNNPLGLAEMLLQGTGWDRKKMDRVIETRETTRVNLAEPLDVLISYWTCGVDADREVFFAPDIYDRDNDVLKELDRLLR